MLVKKIYLALFLILLFPINTKAIYEITDSRCTDNIKSSLKETANAITYRLSRYEEENQTLYKAFILNTSKDIVLTDSKGIVIKNSISKIKEGTKINISMKASDNNYCNGYKLGSFIIDAPYYNEYSSDELCIGYEDYYLCEKNSNITLTKDEFEKQMKAYILNTKNENITVNPISNEENNSIFNYIKDNYINFIIAGGLIVVFVILIKINENRKSEELFLK